MISNTLLPKLRATKIPDITVIDVIMNAIIITLVVAISYGLNVYDSSAIVSKISAFISIIILLTIYLTIKIVMHTKKYATFIPDAPPPEEETLNNMRRYDSTIFNRIGVQKQIIDLMREMLIVFLIIYILISLGLCTIAWSFQTPFTILLAIAGLISQAVYGQYSIDMYARSLLLDEPNINTTFTWTE